MGYLVVCVFSGMLDVWGVCCGLGLFDAGVGSLR